MMDYFLLAIKNVEMHLLTYKQMNTLRIVNY